MPRKSVRTFSVGYIDGWQSVMGKGLVPGIPAHSIPAGKTEYEAGYDRGRADGLERKRSFKPNK